MTHRIVAAATVAAERRDIHNAVCRYRRAGLACGTCSELAERAARALRLEAATIVIGEAA